MKKTLFVKTAALLTVIFVVASFLPSGSRRQADADASDFQGHISKEETVYAVLSADGSISSLIAVSLLNKVKAASHGKFEDHALLEDGSVTVLTPHVEADVHDGGIIFTADEDIAKMYYRGIPVSRELPFTFKITYLLDGAEVLPSAIAGLSGDVEIRIMIRSNKAAGSYFRENFVCQVQVPLSLDVFSLVSAPGGQKMIAGNTATYSFTVLPGTDKDIVIKAEAELFELQPMTVACVPFDISGFLGEDADFSSEDLNKLVDASSDLADGAAGLSEGLDEMKSAIKMLSDSSGALVSGNDELLSGFDGYLDGVTELTGSMLDFSDGLTMTASQGLALYQGFAGLNAQTSALLDILLPLTVSLPEQDQMQIQVMASAIRTGLAEFETSLEKYTEAVQSLAAGSEQISTGMEAALPGAISLQDGIAQTGDGLREFSGAINKLYTGSAELSKGAAELSEGQSEFAKGLSDSIGLFDSFINEPYEGEPVSFMNENMTVDSVQFVITTKAIKITEPERGPDDEIPARSFWQKFIDLFTGIFGK